MFSPPESPLFIIRGRIKRGFWNINYYMVKYVYIFNAFLILDSGTAADKEAIK